MTPERLEALFTHQGGFRFARWGRPVVPVVFGAADESLPAIKGALEAVVALAGHRMAETDPEMGANLFLFFLRDWDELPGVPDLDRLVPGLETLLPKLKAEGAHQYRMFRFDSDGAIRASVMLLRMEGALARTPAEDLALTLAVRAILLWSDGAFAAWPPLVEAGPAPTLRPELASLIRAAYDPVLPAASEDPSLALRLYARIAA